MGAKQHARSAIVGVGLGLLAALSAPAAADDETSAVSRQYQPLCAEREQCRRPSACDDQEVGRLAREADDALKAALKRVGPRAAPLLVRDQVWFQEIAAGGDGPDRPQAAIAAMLEQRITMLREISSGGGRRGPEAKWANAFAEITASWSGDALETTLTMRRSYDQGEERGEGCTANARLTRVESPWLGGPLNGENEEKTSFVLTARLQGETLRVVLTTTSREDAGAPLDCGIDQMTGTYFAIGPGSGTSAAERELVLPSFDCARPETADQEEICADPELAAGDLRLNRAWSRLLPRLDAETRHHLTNDQKRFVAAQQHQHPQFLHPAWDKRGYGLHHLGLARLELARLQKERIALLESFDEGRRGIEGLWLASDAVLSVERGDDGSVTATGWKWFQGDWKAGCEYEMKGHMKGALFVSGEERKNPDTLERERATLVVNRQDDAFARRRWLPDGRMDPDADEQKCRRSQSVSSTSRLFPVRASPDIDQSRSIR